jgi:predicted RNase H-like nuclease (RuvC/YqgF family)
MESTCKKIEVESQNPTLMEMMAEMDRLRKENKFLLNQIIELRLSNELLHNSIEGINKNSDEANDFQTCDSEEYLEAYANAFNDVSLTRFK